MHIISICTCLRHSHITQSGPLLPLLSPVRHVPGAPTALAGTQESLVRRDGVACDLAQLGRLAAAGAQAVVGGDGLVSLLALKFFVVVDESGRWVAGLVVESVVFRGHGLWWVSLLCLVWQYTKMGLYDGRSYGILGNIWDFSMFLYCSPHSFCGHNGWDQKHNTVASPLARRHCDVVCGKHLFGCLGA
ncbi:hypothetical protein BR93DRAFT_752302 [Coniochaeta sp. PMI_546]|nr:hypothetical protein BR93DRAFT_752302 [Coniochaeta sp. PMI_546]